MNTIILTIACSVAALSPQVQPQAKQIVDHAIPTIQECMNRIPKWETKQQMLDTGMVQMDGYQRYLLDPRMQLKAMRDV